VNWVVVLVGELYFDFMSMDFFSSEKF